MKKTTITDISEPRYLIVTADDLCMTEGITKGIVEAYRNGIVTTTSALINYPGARETIIRVYQENPNSLSGYTLILPPGDRSFLLNKFPVLSTRMAISIILIK